MTKIINNSSFEEARKIMKDKFPMIIEYFLEDAAMYIKSIEEGLDSADAEKIKSPAHTIKSSSRQIGAEKMSLIAEKIEKTANDIIIEGAGNMDSIKLLSSELKAALEEADAELKKLM